MGLETPHIISIARHPQLVSLSRLLIRIKQVLVTPDSETEARLRRSAFERAKVRANLNHAGKIFSELEQQKRTIHSQGLIHDNYLDFSKTQQVLVDLTERLKVLNDLANFQDDTSDGEDLLEVYSTPQYFQNENITSQSQTSFQYVKEDTSESSDVRQIDVQPQNDNITEVESSLRPRFKNNQAELLQSSLLTKDNDHSFTIESLLTHNRSEQENLTSSLLQMAKILKTSSLAFSSALEEEKDVLKDTAEGLSRNERGLEATQKRMGLLRKITEGRGWWGRMLMYAWIFALAVVALLIVALLPKLRF
ncbi:putative synaptobrevin protein [Golovinomyces cichoracearum]|uniref:Putative synaptobrevin protein n=1 Tax=Golovinomyces cichoracearum TaxID=62708 RepID=A0A420I6T6_9PEZI|nr:putative synaptobrevin protein [Golovinomyces cichoracearum]